jgi:hypothetical protein
VSSNIKVKILSACSIRFINVNLLLFFILTALFLASNRADAVPAMDDSIVATQPDGTSFQIRIYGDEFQNWQEDVVSGLTIIRNPDNGYWEYAEQLPDGSLQGSGVRVDPSGLAIPPHIPPHLKPSRNQQFKNSRQEPIRAIDQEQLPADSVKLEDNVNQCQSRGVDVNSAASTGGNQ